MADALVSTPVAAAAGAAAITLIAVAANKVKNDARPGLTSLMGVMGAFVFAAQMINFSIPGTGSSGHIIGGILLAAMLGPWAGFITLCSVLIIQCLVFADGGLLALGCNILNMGAVSCLIAYPLIYKPIVGHHKLTPARLMAASVIACTIGLEIGALLVSVETVASGITELPFGQFLMFMMPIHLAIGLCEGVATGLVLAYVWKADPSLLMAEELEPSASQKRRKRAVLWSFAAVALVLAVAFTWIASSDPDGLEWSIMNIVGTPEIAEAATPPTALMPDYDSKLAGLIGALVVMSIIWALGALLFRRKPCAQRP